MATYVCCQVEFNVAIFNWTMFKDVSTYSGSARKFIFRVRLGK